MNEIIKMIVEDDNLFQVKNDGTMDPAALEELRQKRKTELRAKLDKKSLESADKMKEETMKEFSDSRAQISQDFDQKISLATDNFHQKLDSNLQRFEKEIKEALADIHKPLDLLDLSAVRETQYHNIQKIFDLNDYMKNDMETSTKTDPTNSAPKLDEKLNTTYFDFAEIEKDKSNQGMLEPPKNWREMMIWKLKNAYKSGAKKLVCFKSFQLSCFKKP